MCDGCSFEKGGKVKLLIGNVEHFFEGPRYQWRGKSVSIYNLSHEGWEIGRVVCGYGTGKAWRLRDYFDEAFKDELLSLFDSLAPFTYSQSEKVKGVLKDYFESKGHEVVFEHQMGKRKKKR